MNLPKKVLVLGSGALKIGNSTGHWTNARIRFNNHILDDTYTLRAHANLPNNAFPLFTQGRPCGLKASEIENFRACSKISKIFDTIRQVCFTRPSLRNGEISTFDTGNLTSDEDSEVERLNFEQLADNKIADILKPLHLLKHILAYSALWTKPGIR